MVKVSVEARKVTSVPCRPCGVADHRERRHRVAMAEFHRVLFAVAEDAQLEPARQGVDDRDADPVQAARDLVGILVELPARMELGHDDLGGRDAFARVDVDRDAAAVIGHGHRTVGVQRHRHFRCVTGQRLVDGVVHHLVDHVVQARAVIGIADIHAGPLAHRIEALEHLDGIRAIGIDVQVDSRFGHVGVLESARQGGRARRSLIRQINYLVTNC